MSYQYRQIPLQVSADQNVFNEPKELTDSSGTVFVVPAGFWLVEDSAGRISLMSDAAFKAGFEGYKEPVSLESYFNTLEDLRNSDRMAVTRANALEDRIAALEALASTMRNALIAQG